MNISLSFLTLKNVYSNSPFFSISPKETLTMNKIQTNKIYSNLIQSNNFFQQKLYIKHSKFINSLSNIIHISELQTFSKTKLYKNNENQIEIEESQFIQCKTTNSKEINGGCIHLEDIKNISIIKCSFLLCSSIKEQNEKGGAIFISGETKQLLLRENCFSECSTSTDGNAFYANINHELNSQIHLNMISIHQCPYFLKKKQHASIFLNSPKIITSVINISECHSLLAPSFSYNSSNISQHSHYTILNQTGGKKFVLFDFESHSEQIKTSFFQKWNIIFEEPKNKMLFKVDKHSLNNVIFYGGEFDYSIEVINGDLHFSSVRSDKRLKISRGDDKNPAVIEKYTFDKDSIKLNSLGHVKDNQCKLIFQLPEEKSQISFIYLIAPVLIIGIGLGFTLSVSFLVKKLGETPKQREDEQMLRKKPKAISK